MTPVSDDGRIARLIGAHVATARQARAVEDLAVAAAGDAEAYRRLALEALRQLADAHHRASRLSAQLVAVRDEIRRYTAAAVHGRAA